MTGARGLVLDMFQVGCVPRHGDDKGIGYTEGGGGGGGWCWGGGGGGERNAVSHTGDEKTTKIWEADDRARDRLKIRRVGTDNQNKGHCRLCLLNDTTPHNTLGLWF
jgi:hypothetical protein